MYLYHNAALSISFTQIFQTGNQIHKIQPDTLTFTGLVPVEKNIKKFLMLFQGPRIWHSLLNNIKNTPTFNIFKRVIKAFLRADRMQPNYLNTSYLYFFLNLLNI